MRQSKPPQTERSPGNSIAPTEAAREAITEAKAGLTAAESTLEPAEDQELAENIQALVLATQAPVVLIRELREANPDQADTLDPTTILVQETEVQDMEVKDPEQAALDLATAVEPAALDLATAVKLTTDLKLKT